MRKVLTTHQRREEKSFAHQTETWQADDEGKKIILERPRVNIAQGNNNLRDVFKRYNLLPFSSPFLSLSTHVQAIYVVQGSS